MSACCMQYNLTAFNQSQSLLIPKCAARSVGTANTAFMQLIQTILAAHCSLSSPCIWPKDHEPIRKNVFSSVFTFDFIISTKFFKKKSVSMKRWRDIRLHCDWCWICWLCGCKSFEWGSRLYSLNNWIWRRSASWIGGK